MTVKNKLVGVDFRKFTGSFSCFDKNRKILFCCEFYAQNKFADIQNYIFFTS